MKRHINKIKTLAFSATARDTFVLFVGNASSAFLGFLYTLIVARALSVSDFGIFSAATNLVVMLVSLTDFGISTGIVNFISENEAKKNYKKSGEYIKAATIARFSITFIISSIVILFASFVSPKLLATSDPSMSVWVGLITISLALPMLFPFMLQAKRKFFLSVIADNSLYFFRLIVSFAFMFISGLTLGNSLSSFVFGGVFGTIVGVIFLKPKFLISKPKKDTYSKLLKFSGWIGVNRIISSISGRLDVQMIAVMLGSVTTGIYAIPNRLAGFVTVLTSSFSGVLAPRLASIGDKEKEKKYILKALLALVPIVAGLIFWIIIAKPFIVILFGEKYLPAVPVFQALTAAMIPFVFTAPSVAAIIYAMKKTFYIGAYSFFQIVAIFILNLVLIPKFGIYGPTITLGVTNLILAIYTWFIVIRHYWFEK